MTGGDYDYMNMNFFPIIQIIQKNLCTISLPCLLGNTCNSTATLKGSLAHRQLYSLLQLSSLCSEGLLINESGCSERRQHTWQFGPDLWKKLWMWTLYLQTHVHFWVVNNRGSQSWVGFFYIVGVLASCQDPPDFNNINKKFSPASIFCRAPLLLQIGG
jgi:hypothetical protein